MTRDEIRLLGVRGTGYHGVLDHERRDGQEFVVDVVLTVDLRRAGRTDDLADTVNYAEVAAAVLARIQGEPHDLIETLADRIASDVLHDERVDAVEVTVHKPQAPVGVPFGDVQVRIRREHGVPVVIALGANLGDRVATLTEAVRGLRDVPGLTVTAVSDLVETEPVGGPQQPAFLNAVALARASIQPDELLRHLHAVEHASGRERQIRWGPRTLDLDLVQYGTPGTAAEVRSGEPALLVPHPHAPARAFVLVPWVDVDPQATIRLGHRVPDPIERVTEVLATLDTSGVRPGPPWAPLS